MSWETPGGRRYYFTAKKVNGRVVKRYVGAGDLAGAMAGLEALDRERRQEQRAAGGCKSCNPEKRANARTVLKPRKKDASPREGRSTPCSREHPLQSVASLRARAAG
jgi:hypothetical protein